MLGVGHEVESYADKEARVVRAAEEEAKAFASQMDALQAERLEASENEYLRNYETFLKQDVENLDRPYFVRKRMGVSKGVENAMLAAALRELTKSLEVS